MTTPLMPYPPPSTEGESRRHKRRNRWRGPAYKREFEAWVKGRLSMAVWKYRDDLMLYGNQHISTAPPPMITITKATTL